MNSRLFRIILKFVLLPFFGLILFFSLSYYFLLIITNVALIENFLTLIPQTRLDGVNVLALGLDEMKDVQRTDTIMVLHLDAAQKRIGLLSIPRDTKTKVEGYGETKINHAYAYGGVPLLRKTVSELLNVPIQYYVVMNLEGVKTLVDHFGGVQVEVEKDLRYKDKEANLDIELKKGEQSLSGEKAAEYLRFRHDNDGDIGRIHRQQTFLKALVDKFLGAGRAFEIPGLIRELATNMQTDMTMKQVVGLTVQFSEAFKEGHIETGSIPGMITLEHGVSYWRPEIAALDRTVDDVLLGLDSQPVVADSSRIVTQDKSASEEPRRTVTLKEAVRVTEQKDITKPQEIAASAKALSIEVLNGCGIPGEAKRAADILKSLGVKVSRYANSGSFRYDETKIVDWKSKVDDVLVIAQLLHVDPANIIVYDRPEKSLDVTVVLGKDWDQLKSKLTQGP